jgi:TRAP-type C4-dicarboxylate transport system permease small subunit
MMSPFNKILNSTVGSLRWVAAGALVVMMVITTANVVLRIIYRPILGAPEIVTHGLIVLASLGLIDAVFGRRNICVDLFTSRLPRKAQAVIGVFTWLLSLGVFSAMAWQGFLVAWEKLMKGEYEPILGFPVSPFRWLVAICLSILCVVLLRDLFQSAKEVIK